MITTTSCTTSSVATANTLPATQVSSALYPTTAAAPPVAAGFVVQATAGHPCASVPNTAPEGVMGAKVDAALELAAIIASAVGVSADTTVGSRLAW